MKEQKEEGENCFHNSRQQHSHNITIARLHHKVLQVWRGVASDRSRLVLLLCKLFICTIWRVAAHPLLKKWAGQVRGMMLEILWKYCRNRTHLCGRHKKWYCFYKTMRKRFSYCFMFLFYFVWMFCFDDS